MSYTAYRRLFQALMILSPLAMVPFFLVVNGVAEPYIPAEALPGYALYFGLITIVVIMVMSGYGASLMAAWRWEAVGAEAGLRPAEEALPRPSLSHTDSGYVKKPILTATVNGRTVRARIVKVGGGSNSSTKKYTMVEADLREPLNVGALVSRGDKAFGLRGVSVPIGDSLKWPSMSDEFDGLTAIRDDPFLAQTDAESLVRRVLSGRAKNRLRAPDTFGLLLIGDSKSVYRQLWASFKSQMGDKMPEIGGFSLGSVLPDLESLPERFNSGDALTVTHRLQGALLDAGDLERHVAAVAAVADALERAKSRMDG